MHYRSHRPSVLYSSRVYGTLEFLLATTIETLNAMDLNSPQVTALVHLIKDSFRVRKNVRPVYVDVGENLARLDAPQHQIVFGRRGSGKSCLLVEYLKTAETRKVTPIYVLADEFKKLAYPDILIRLLIEIIESLSCSRPWYRKLFTRKSAVRSAATELRALLDVALESDVSEGRESRSSVKASASVKAPDIGDSRLGSERGKTQTRTAQFREKKIDTLERHLRDYKNAIEQVSREWRHRRGCVLVDDFYLLPREWQPDVIDYFHRLLRDTDVYLKVATIRHRTTLLRNHPQTVGVELAQDVEEINLDRTLEDLEETQLFLSQMLHSMGEKAGVPKVVELFNPDALQALTLASGGVPRDFLTIFVHAVEAALSEGKSRWVTPRHIYKGAGRLSYQTKLKHLREDANGDAGGLERVLVDLMGFCLKNKRKTGFLVSQDEAQGHAREHELIQQLMDFKLIHVVEPDTSAASGRPGRYEAYTLDFSLFMEPRRRNIDLVEFWKRGEDSHRIGVRELPVYSLDQAKLMFDDTSVNADPEKFLEDSENEAAADVSTSAEPGGVSSTPVQGPHFEDPTKQSGG